LNGLAHHAVLPISGLGNLPKDIGKKNSPKRSSSLVGNTINKMESVEVGFLRREIGH